MEISETGLYETDLSIPKVIIQLQIHKRQEQASALQPTTPFVGANCVRPFVLLWSFRAHTQVRPYKGKAQRPFPTKTIYRCL